VSEQAGASRILAARPIDAAGGGELFWQRLKRDRVAVGAALFIALVFVACFALEPLFEHLLGHGPDDIFPFAVDQLTLTRARRVPPFARGRPGVARGCRRATLLAVTIGRCSAPPPATSAAASTRRSRG